MDNPTIYTVRYVKVSDLNFAEELFDDALNYFTWGDTDHTLVSKREMHSALHDALDGRSFDKYIRKAMSIIDALDDDVFIDLES